MNMVIKSFSRRCLGWIIFFVLLMTALFYLGGCWLWQAATRVLPASAIEEAAEHSPEFKAGLETLRPWVLFGELYFLPIAFGTFLLLGLILWLLLRRSLVRQMRKAGFLDDKKPLDRIDKKEKIDKGEKTRKKKGKKDTGAKEPGKTAGLAEDKEQAQAEKKARTQMTQRYYLHLLSVLQRQGRLLDFFEEDLNQYADDQIGAAVRSIQDNCKKTVNKALSPAPVIEKAEGEAVNVPADFDPSAIKLTGNVSGEPPFKGILRHRGWRAARLELPTLSAEQDPRIMAPAEVEIT